MKVKCKRCKHEWEYTGKKEQILKSKNNSVEWPLYINCPTCHTTVNLRKMEDQK